MMSGEPTPGENELLTEKFYQSTCALLDVLYNGANPELIAPSYDFILQAGNWNIVQLRHIAAQEIPKFFSFYPGLQEKAIDAQLVTRSNCRIYVKMKTPMCASKLLPDFQSLRKLLRWLLGLRMCCASCCKARMKENCRLY
jgi:hypothetical protein